MEAAAAGAAQPVQVDLLNLYTVEAKYTLPMDTKVTVGRHRDVDNDRMYPSNTFTCLDCTPPSPHARF